MSSFLTNIFRFVFFILLQEFVLNKIPTLHQFITPYIYFLYILWLPFKLGRWNVLLLSFLFGLTMDFFTGTMGLHAAACTLIGYIRPFLLSLLIPQETTEQSYLEPSIKSMGWAPFSLYIGLLTFVHHFYLVLLEWLQFGNFTYFIGKVGGATGISLLLIFLAEMLFNRKAKYRTNS
ncbi:MAG: rod shape-determining protein MreD [Chitinophaga sp.]|jgi:rod shape-determining protein MreD|nr:rod shape-determining protein MreD [Chitinophaga sp.]PJE46067.1 MAG: rod shape-determining protein MreD [Sediminibacterium sp.] [Sediminibacterium sp. FEMGT703S]